MRVFHVLSRLDVGGMERMVVQLAADGVDHGDDVVVACAGGSWVTRLGDAGARYVELPPLSRSPARLARAGLALAGALRHQAPDVVHAHNVTAAAAARTAIILARPWRPAPLLVTLHGLAPDDYRGAARALRVTARRVIACSPAVRRRLTEAGYPAARVDVITNGAALEPATDDRIRVLYQSLGVEPERAVVGVGRLVDQKDWPTFLDVAARMPGRPFVIAGAGPLADELEARARTLGAPVTFAGAVDDMAALLGGAACLLSTSRWEGLPLALLEALSLGTPAVVTRVDGVADLVPADAARFVPVGDPVRTAAVVTDLLEGDEAPRLAAAARRASGEWSPATMLARYRDAYRAVVGL